MSTSNSSLLKNALVFDGVLSFISGAALLIFPKAIAGLLNLSASWIIPAAGAAVIAYGMAVYLAARAEPVNIHIARFAAYGNLAAVLGSAVLLYANLLPFTAAGKWTVAIAADAVLVLAIFQYAGLRRYAR